MFKINAYTLQQHTHNCVSIYYLSNILHTPFPEHNVQFLSNITNYFYEPLENVNSFPFLLYICHFVCTVMAIRQCFVTTGITSRQPEFLVVRKEGLLVKVCQHSEQATDFLLLAFNLDIFISFFIQIISYCKVVFVRVNIQ